MYSFWKGKRTRFHIIYSKKCITLYFDIVYYKGPNNSNSIGLFVYLFVNLLILNVTVATIFGEVLSLISTHMHRCIQREPGVCCNAVGVLWRSVLHVMRE